jgi:hypothetical protein
MADLNSTIALSFASYSRKLHWKRMKCSKQFSVIMPWGEHELLRGFVDSNTGKFQLKTVSVQLVPLQFAHKETRTKLVKSSTHTDEVPFRKSMQAKPLKTKYQRIKDLNTRRISVKFVTRLLTIRSSGKFCLLKT